MPKVNLYEYEIANGLGGGSTIDEIIAYIHEKKDTEATFYFHNGFSYTKYVSWKFYDDLSPSIIVDHGEDLSIKSKESSKKITVKDLTPNCNYTLEFKYEIPVDEYDSDIVTKKVSVVTKRSANTTNYGNFSFLYDKIESKSPCKDVTGYGLKITKISPKNGYYINYKFPFYLYPWHGANHATAVRTWYTEPFAGSVVPNCVGYAHGRVKEIWGRCVEQGYIKKRADSNSFYIVNSNKDITGVVDVFGWSNAVPPCGYAYQFYDLWPNIPGWTKSSQPAIGAIMCWSGGGDGCGHVAVVESIDNATGDVIVSESCWGAGNPMARMNKYYKSGNYPMSGYSFRGFLISPVCQIVGSGSFGFMEEILLEIDEKPVTERDQATYTELSHIHETKLTEALNLNDKVEIQWFGNTKGDGTGKSVGHLTSIGKISKINWNNKYPYEITLNKEVIGYYDRSSLIKYNGSSSSSGGVLSLLGNIKTNNNVLYTATVNVGNSSLYIRSNASKTSNILGSLKTGAVVNVYETKTQNGYTWCKISPNRNEWVASGDANETWLVVDSSTTSESYLYRAEAKAELNKRKTPEYKSDGSNIHKNSNGSNKKVSQGEIVSVYEEINTPDSYDYVWRRIGENVWVADSDKAYPFGHYLAKINESPVSTPKASKKTISVHPNIEIYVRSTPAIRDDNKLYKLSPGTYIGHWYGETTVADGYTWYRISETESKWVAGANLVFSS